MLVVCRSAAVSVVHGISEEIEAPAKRPEQKALPQLVALLAARAGLEVARLVSPLAVLVSPTVAGRMVS
jgi:hypothetical protein